MGLQIYRYFVVSQRFFILKFAITLEFDYYYRSNTIKKLNKK